MFLVRINGKERERGKKSGEGKGPCSSQAHEISVFTGNNITVWIYKSGRWKYIPLLNIFRGREPFLSSPTKFAGARKYS